MYFEVMGEKFPEDETYEKKKKIRTRTKKEIPETSTTENRRKSLRNHAAVNYKELSVNEKKLTVKEKHSSEETKYNLEINKSKTTLVKICDVCQTEFHTIIELKSHIKMDHKRFFFNCPTCELPMYSKDNLEKHYKLKHRIDVKLM